MAVVLSLLNWLVPGTGYVLAGDVLRGAILFVLLNGCFALGLWWNGFILVPPAWKDPSFNIVSFLTFVVQMFHGGGTLLEIWCSRTGNLPMLVRDPGATYSDLGALHLLVAGGLNYFASVRLFDLLTDQAGNDTPGKEVTQS